MHLQKIVKIHQSIHTILSINKILTSIKGHNSVENEQKVLFNHPNLHLVNINAYAKFDRNPQINSQDTEHKQNSDVDQGPQQKSTKIMYITHNMGLVYINAQTQFYQNLSICSEDIEKNTFFT